MARARQCIFWVVGAAALLEQSRSSASEGRDLPRGLSSEGSAEGTESLPLVLRGSACLSESGDVDHSFKVELWASLVQAVSSKTALDRGRDLQGYTLEAHVHMFDDLACSVASSQTAPLRFHSQLEDGNWLAPARQGSEQILLQTSVNEAIDGVEEPRLIIHSAGGFGVYEDSGADVYVVLYNFACVWFSSDQCVNSGGNYLYNPPSGPLLLRAQEQPRTDIYFPGPAPRGMSAVGDVTFELLYASSTPLSREPGWTIRYGITIVGNKEAHFAEKQIDGRVVLRCGGVAQRDPDSTRLTLDLALRCVNKTGLILDDQDRRTPTSFYWLLDDSESGEISWDRGWAVLPKVYLEGWGPRIITQREDTTMAVLFTDVPSRSIGLPSGSINVGMRVASPFFSEYILDEHGSDYSYYLATASVAIASPIAFDALPDTFVTGVASMTITSDSTSAVNCGLGPTAAYGPCLHEVPSQIFEIDYGRTLPPLSVRRLTTGLEILYSGISCPAPACECSKSALCKLSPNITFPEGLGPHVGKWGQKCCEGNGYFLCPAGWYFNGPNARCMQHVRVLLARDMPTCSANNFYDYGTGACASTGAFPIPRANAVMLQVKTQLMMAPETSAWALLVHGSDGVWRAIGQFEMELPDLTVGRSAVYAFGTSYDTMSSAPAARYRYGTRVPYTPIYPSLCPKGFRAGFLIRAPSFEETDGSSLPLQASSGAPVSGEGWIDDGQRSGGKVCPLDACVDAQGVRCEPSASDKQRQPLGASQPPGLGARHVRQLKAAAGRHRRVLARQRRVVETLRNKSSVLGALAPPSPPLTETTTTASTSADTFLSEEYYSPVMSAAAALETRAMPRLPQSSNGQVGSYNFLPNVFGPGLESGDVYDNFAVGYFHQGGDPVLQGGESENLPVALGHFTVARWPVPPSPTASTREDPVLNYNGMPVPVSSHFAVIPNPFLRVGRGTHSVRRPIVTSNRDFGYLQGDPNVGFFFTVINEAADTLALIIVDWRGTNSDGTPASTHILLGTSEIFGDEADVRWFDGPALHFDIPGVHPAAVSLVAKSLNGTRTRSVNLGVRPDYKGLAVIGTPQDVSVYAGPCATSPIQGNRPDGERFLGLAIATCAIEAYGPRTQGGDFAIAITDPVTGAPAGSVQTQIPNNQFTSDPPPNAHGNLMLLQHDVSLADGRTTLDVVVGLAIILGRVETGDYEVGNRNPDPLLVVPFVWQDLTRLIQLGDVEQVYVPFPLPTDNVRNSRFNVATLRNMASQPQSALIGFWGVASPDYGLRGLYEYLLMVRIGVEKPFGTTIQRISSPGRQIDINQTRLGHSSVYDWNPALLGLKNLEDSQLISSLSMIGYNRNRKNQVRNTIYIVTNTPLISATEDSPDLLPPRTCSPGPFGNWFSTRKGGAGSVHFQASTVRMTHWGPEL